MANTINEAKVAALLSRPLTATEITNFDLYLDIAKLRLNYEVCFDITDLTQYGEGVTEIPNDLALVWARFFGGISAEASQQKNGGVASKRVEDFQVAYRDGYDPLSELINLNSTTIAKYSKCSSGVRHGRTIFDEGERHDRV